MVEEKAKKSFANRLMTWGLVFSALPLVGWIADQVTASPTNWATCTVTRIDITEIVVDGAVQRASTHVSSINCGASGNTSLKNQIAFKDLNQLRGGSKVLCQEFRTTFFDSTTIRNCKIGS